MIILLGVEIKRDREIFFLTKSKATSKKKEGGIDGKLKFTDA